MKTFLLRLPSDVHRAVKVAAADRGITMQEYINGLLRDNMPRPKKSVIDAVADAVKTNKSGLRDLVKGS